MNFIAIAWVCANTMISSCELMVVQTPLPTYQACEQKLAEFKPVLDEYKKTYSLFCFPIKTAKIAL